MRFAWISSFAPGAQGVRWACGLLLLPAVWLAKGGGTPVAPAVGHPAAAAVHGPRWVARPALDSVRAAR